MDRSGKEEVLTPEDILDREQAIAEAQAGKLDYLLEDTQWDPRYRNTAPIDQQANVRAFVEQMNLDNVNPPLAVKNP